MAESWKKLKTSNIYFRRLLCVRMEKRSALLRELLSNNSLFVGQLCEYKSLALWARDLIFFTTDLQTVNYYSTIHAIELIYFLIKVKKKAQIRNRYNQVPHLTRDTIWESDKTHRNITVHSPFPAGDHKAARNRQDSIIKTNVTKQNDPF